jgi:NADH:ubiquinone oxidoreductase subunit K
MIDLSQCFTCGLVIIGLWAFFTAQLSVIRWLMAIEILILSATTELLIAGQSQNVFADHHAIALFWMTFAAIELAVGLAFVRKLSENSASLVIEVIEQSQQES